MNPRIAEVVLKLYYGDFHTHGSWCDGRASKKGKDVLNEMASESRKEIHITKLRWYFHPNIMVIREV